MRQLAVPLLVLLAACAGGGGSTDPTSPNPTGTPTGTGGTWSDAIVGDGEIDPAAGDAESDDVPSMSAAAGASSAKTSAGSSSSGSSSSGGAASSSGSSGSSGSTGGTTSTGDSGESSSGTGGWTSPPPSTDYSSLLTAGAWDDNRNFSFFSGYRTKILQSPNDGYLGISDAEANAAKALFATPALKTTLDVSLMIDTTGSMEDEISYLQREFTSISAVIEQKYPQAQQHWSLVLYKDKHDPYIVKWFDFRADATEFQQKLMVAEASGGGDFPESPEQALGVAHRLSWRQDANTARLLFWVADAPHHAEDTQAMTTAVKAARDKGIHVYPVAASGVDEFTEYTMRSTAQLTGGRYLFLTDDSGIGDTHEVPILPCYFVTKLDKAILRMVDIELSGTYREPSTDEILRTGGDPQNGYCQADGGVQVQIF